MRLHRSSLMTGVALAAMVTAAPMAAQAQTSPETGIGAADEQLLTCRAEFRALQETLRSEPEFAEFEAEFDRLLQEANDPELSADAGVCFVNLVEARQMLAGQGIALEGYTDEAAIYSTIEQARAAGAFTNVEAEEARQRTEITVETRPARVAVTPQQARVSIQREATQVSVSQRPSEITVEQPQAQIAVQQAQPDIDVTQPAPEVQVQAAAPEVEVVQPAPEIQVQQAQPEVAVTQAQPQVTITQPKPQITVRQFEPEVEIVQPQPEITVTQPEPQIAVVQPEPEVTVEAAEPVVTVQQAEPEVAVDYAKPEVNVRQREPEVTVEAAQPQVSVTEAEPQVRVSQGQPQVRVSQAEPTVNVSQGEAEVAVTQQQARVTAEMGEAEVSVDVASGADVTTSQTEGDVTVSMEDEPAIRIAEARDMPQRLADLEPMALEEIEFRFDSAELSDIAIGNVEDAVGVMRDSGEEMRAVLVGFASPIGEAGYNLELSRNRVEAVRQAMVDRGIGADQIVTFAAGESETEQEVANAEARRTEENRRVDIRIMPATTYASATSGQTGQSAETDAQGTVTQDETLDQEMDAAAGQDEISGQDADAAAAQDQATGQEMGGAATQDEAPDQDMDGAAAQGTTAGQDMDGAATQDEASGQDTDGAASQGATVEQEEFGGGDQPRY